MRIAILARGMRRTGGVGRLLGGYVGSLPKAAPEDEFIVITDEPLPESMRAANVSEVVIEKANPVLFDHLEVPQAIKRLSPDALLATKNAVPVGLRCPVVCVFLDLAYFAMAQAYPFADNIYMRAMFRRSARVAARIIALSNSTKDDVGRFLGKKALDKTVVAYPGVGLPFRRMPDEERAAARARMADLPERFVLYAGNISPRKNIRRLVEAVSALGGKASLVMTGHRGWKSAGLMRLIDGISTSGTVTVLGGLPDEDLTALYNLATMSVYPSLYEGFGFPVIESFACGTPAAASNATSIPEAAGDAAVLFDPTDANEIAGAIEMVLGDEKLRAEMTEKGLRRAAEFSWERTAEQVLGVLREIA